MARRAVRGLLPGIAPAALLACLGLGLSFGVIGAAVAPGTAWAAPERCDPGEVWLRGDFGELRFSAELADDPAERARGLMHRESMARGAGMLFVYEYPQPAAFWMKNTLIPLDMIFMDEAGVVTRVHANAIPHDETAIPGGDAVKAVLEINGGLAAALGITEGAELRHPALGPEAAWACPGAAKAEPAAGQ